MNTNTALKCLSIIAAVIVALTWPLMRVRSTEPAADLIETTTIEKEGELGIGEKIEDADARDAFRRLQLQDENGEIAADAWNNAIQQKEAMQFLPEAWCEFMQCGIVGPAETPDWVSIGPGNIGGRIRSMVIHPQYPNPPTIWVGAVSGGVWKTTNGGDSWVTTTDTIAHMGVACMVIDPQNSNTLYAGTGEKYVGTGVYKTVDGGAHWTPLSGTASFGAINRLAICPTDSQLILAATESGVWRTENGGGVWLRVITTSRMNDVDFKPTDVTTVPGVRCIAGDSDGNAYHSTNGGETWMPANWSGGQHGPGRVELGYSRSNSSIVYASVGVLGGQIFRSTDGGENFLFKGNPFVATNRFGPNGWANALWVDPVDPNSNTILAGGQYLSRSTDGGVNWEEASSNTTHQDHHVIVEDPRYDRTNNLGGKTVFGGNDGGIYRTDDILLPCPNGDCVLWNPRNNTLAITQFYGAAGHNINGTIIGGNQDNGTVRYTGNSETWDYMRQGDGGFCAVDQSSNPYFYGEHVFLTIYRSTNGGTKALDIYQGIADANLCDQNGCHANFTAPFILDPNDTTGNTMLAGGRRLWRSSDVRITTSKPTFTAIKDQIPGNCAGDSCNINAIAVAEGNSNVIWVGHNDGSVFYTTNGTTAVPTWVQVGGLPTGLICTRITISPLLPTSVPGERPVYVTFGGFSNQGHVWKTTSNGVMWTDISGNLPNAPVYSLVVSRSDADILYIGTEVGFFAKKSGAISWSPGSGGVSNSSVVDVFWVGPNLVAATHGRSMFMLSSISE